MATQAVKTALDYLQASKRHPVDEQTIPEWGPGPDGRLVNISRDERLPGLFEAWQADACAHERTGIVRWVNAGNAVCFNWFCPDCGTQLSQNVGHELALAHGYVDREDANRDSLASRFNAYRDQRERFLGQIKADAAERAQPGNREEYDDYLRSPRWRTLRNKVLARPQGQCEGCLDAPAEQVHHLTYAHRGAEFAFELIALCRDCHERLHEAAE
jgi:hypothetical protein